MDNCMCQRVVVEQVEQGANIVCADCGKFIANMEDFGDAVMACRNAALTVLESRESA